jgi:hypothetical protein
VCLECGLATEPSYNSCRNRNCPKCQALAQARWIATRGAAILPVPHFHGVFTLPEDLRALAFHPHPTFRTKDGRKLSLPPVAFLRRFVQHVLPDGYKKIRHAGLYAAPKALAEAKALLGTTPGPTPAQPTWQDALRDLTGVDATRCKSTWRSCITQSSPSQGFRLDGWTDSLA